MREEALDAHTQEKLKHSDQALLTTYFHTLTKRERDSLQEDPPPKKARLSDPEQSPIIPKIKQKLINNHIITKKDRLRAGIFPKLLTNTLCTH